MALTRPSLIPGDYFTISPAARSSGLLISGGIGAASAGLAVLTASPWVALGLPLGILGCLIVVLRALTDTLIISESAVIVRRGLLGADISIMAFAHVRVNVRQSPIGRLLNMGTVYLDDGEQRAVLAYIGDIDRLVAVLVDRLGTSRILLDYRWRKL